MDRRYYGAKALVVVIGVALAGFMTVAPSDSYRISMTREHYGAAAEVQMALMHTGINVVHVVRKLLHFL